MHQADFQFRKSQAQHFISLKGRLELQSLGFFNQRTNPIGLFSGMAGFPDTCGDFIAARIRDQFGHYRGSAGRQSVDHRHIKIGIIAHRKRAWNGRGAHHQLMRHWRRFSCLSSLTPAVGERQTDAVHQ